MAPTQTVRVTSSSKTRWSQKEIQVSAALRAACGDEFLARLLAVRGITDEHQVQQFLEPRYEHLRLFGGTSQHSPLGLDVAVARLIQAINGKQRILVFGDYDVDGVTGSAALVDALRVVGADVTAQLPHRERDGYGLQLGSLPGIVAAKPQLVVTVDNGIQSHDAIGQLQKQGIDVIVLDHHEPGPELPPAAVVVNPKQAGETAPFKPLCAGGIVYRVIEALFAALGVPDGQEKWYLDLAALATVCDMVPLRGDNRLLVHFGLKTLAKTRRTGLRNLLDQANKDQPITAETIGFRVGPRLNAAGRLEHAKSALDLLLTRAPLEAVRLTQTLDQLNRERQQHTRRVVEQALLLAEADLSQPALVLMHPDWLKGVCGLAAGKLAERFNRPVFVLQEAKQCVGSGRSVPGVSLAAAIESMRPLFIKAGGHAAAAGCTLERANVAAFRDGLVAFTTAARGSSLPPRTIEFDVDVPLTSVSLNFLDLQKQLEPFGMGNPRPVVRLRECRIDSLRLVGADQKHVSLVVRQGNQTRRAIAFGKADQFSGHRRGDAIDVLATVRQNDWGGKSSAELEIIDSMSA